MKTMMDEYRAFTQSIIQAGQFKAGDALQATSTATTVTVRGGKTLTTDGPFARPRAARRLLPDRGEESGRGDRYRGRVPSAKFGSIEVRR